MGFFEALIISLLVGWGFNELTSDLTNEPICQVEEVHKGQKVLVPKYCSELLEKK